jgi:hypothetical protein
LFDAAMAASQLFRHIAAAIKTKIIIPSFISTDSS